MRQTERQLEWRINALRPVERDMINRNNASSRISRKCIVGNVTDHMHQSFLAAGVAVYYVIVFRDSRCSAGSRYLQFHLMRVAASPASPSDNCISRLQASIFARSDGKQKPSLAPADCNNSTHTDVASGAAQLRLVDRPPGPLPTHRPPLW